MKNLMDTYLAFTEKNIKKYMKIIFSKYYDEEIVDEYLRTYVNARYYNIKNTEKEARAFYLRILDELNYKEQILLDRNERETEREYKEEKEKMINNVKQVFSYVLFFDDVRKVDNFKNINSIKEVIKKFVEIVSKEYKITKKKEIEDKLYNEIKEDMIEKEVFLDKFETDEFSVSFENSEYMEDLYYTTLEYNINMPVQYSVAAIEKVFNEGIVAEDKLQIEYTLLSLIIIRDIINGDFKDIYIAEFASTLFKKKQKLDSILALIGNQALQEKIHINIEYSDYIKNQKAILEYTNKGYNFVITLDGSVKTIEDIEKLKMFKIVIAPKKLELFKEIKANKAILKNVIYK